MGLSKTSSQNPHPTSLPGPDETSPQNPHPTSLPGPNETSPPNPGTCFLPQECDLLGPTNHRGVPPIPRA